MTTPPETLARLAEAAREVLGHAYAPYSRYPVSAAMLDDLGNVHTGVNVENASYGATLCAERSAVASLVTSGARRWLALVVVTRDAARPCGLCRQVLAEFAHPEAWFVACLPDGPLSGPIPFSQLVPEWFTADPDRFPQLQP